jgi:tetratricopeptide (TPR) repeat protein
VLGRLDGRTRMTTRLQHGNRFLVEKRYEEALDEFLAHAREVPSEAPRAFVQAAECLRRTNTLTAPIPVEGGVTLISQSDTAGAEAMYRRALAVDPAYFPALRGLAQVLPEGPALRAALETAVGITLDPLLVEQLGELYETEGLLTEARDLYSRALQATPSRSDERHIRAALDRVTKRMSYLTRGGPTTA